MTHTHSAGETGGAETARAQAPSGAASGHSVYVYESSGIAEREGHVPLWLWIVVVLLSIWGVYYLVAFWNAPMISP